MNYRGCFVLAPMVRCGTLPLRLLALQYGADLVYTEEIIDVKLLQTQRVENRRLNTVDYVKDHSVVLRTLPARERGHLVLQLGTSNPDVALSAARHVLQDVDAIDINMGCPVHFSVHGGMGSALLSKPDVIESILRKLVENVPKPVTCKIRLLETFEKTLELVKRIESCGVAAIGVHGRRIPERPREPAHLDQVERLAAAVRVPLIVSGDMWTRDSALEMMRRGVASAMFARGALRNPSLFRREGELPLLTAMRDYIRLCVDTENVANNAKYTLLQMFRHANATKMPEVIGITRSKTLAELCAVLGETEHYEQTQALHAEQADEVFDNLAYTAPAPPSSSADAAAAPPARAASPTPDATAATATPLARAASLTDDAGDAKRVRTAVSDAPAA